MTTTARMLLMVLAAFAALMAGCGGGGGGGGGSAVIEGRVLDDGSLLAIEGALITVGADSTTSAADGGFSLQTSPGTRIITITADGYRQRQITRTLTEGTNNLGPQYLQPQLLEGRGAVRGLLTRNGTPEAGATVLSGTARATSKADGSYALYNIEAGERTITAISGDGQATGVTTVSVAAGTTRTGVDIALSLAPPPPPSL